MLVLEMLQQLHNWTRLLKLLKTFFLNRRQDIFFYLGRYYKWCDRAEVYGNFEVLCKEKTKKHVAWAVRNYIRSCICTCSPSLFVSSLTGVKEDTKRYGPKIRNVSFHRHVQYHQKPIMI